MKNNIKVKQAVILCGGLGTRLGNLTKNTPKPLLKINKSTFIDHIINHLVKYKFKKIILLTGYKSNQFKKKYHLKKIKNTIIFCKSEKKLMGTGGALVDAYRYLDNYFLLVNGDTFLDINYFDFIQKFKPNNSKLLMALIKKKNTKYGGVRFIKNRVVSLSKKNINSKYINSGLYILDKSFLKTKEKNKYYSLENDFIQDLIKKNKVQSDVRNDFNIFIDIGTKNDLRTAKKIMKDFKRPAVFLDRDGVINEDLGYVHKINQFVWRKDVIKSIKLLNDKNYFVFVITNQSGIGRGYYSVSDVKKLHDWMNETLYKNGAMIDDYFIAPYFKGSKNYSSNFHFNLRKPNTGMIKLINKKWAIDKKKMYLFGDQETDLQLGKKILAKTFLIKKKTNILKVIKKNKI